MSHSRESSTNLLFHEVKNLSRRLNDFQQEFGTTVQVLQEATLSQLLDVEFLTKQIQQLTTKIEYVEELLKAAK